MKIKNALQNVGTLLDLKRIASAYVIDYRNLSEEEIRAAIIKTAPQYYFEDNVRKTVDFLLLNDDRNIRILSRLMLVDVLLQKDDFMSPQRKTETEIINIEQETINQSNEDLLQKSNEREKSLELFQFILETAWEHNDSISPDEKNLIGKLKKRLKVTDREYQTIEAKLGKYPKPGNVLNTVPEIEEARRLLQSKGLLFSVRNDDMTDFDIIPEEIATTIRKVFNIEIKNHGYKQLLNQKYVRSKKYYKEMLDKCDIPFGRADTIDSLQTKFLEQVKPSLLLGGVSPNDGLSVSDLRKWCSDLGVLVSGTKQELISRTIEYYDNLIERQSQTSDEREIWYKHFDEFASRNLDFLRSQQLITKDIECETKFEEATNYLFENKLHHKPLKLVGTSHADGALSYKDGIVYWDNKSKETPVNLKDHLKQFDNYIRSSEKPVACFMVIAPSFTDKSSVLAMQYQVDNGTIVSLITSSEIKQIAEMWEKKSGDKSEDPFPLGYLMQPGRLNMGIINI